MSDPAIGPALHGLHIKITNYGVPLREKRCFQQTGLPSERPHALIRAHAESTPCSDPTRPFVAAKATPCSGAYLTNPFGDRAGTAVEPPKRRGCESHRARQLCGSLVRRAMAESLTG
jgi:hypothetical protein